MRLFPAEARKRHAEYLACFAAGDAVRVEWHGKGYPAYVHGADARGLWIGWPSGSDGDIVVRDGETLHVIVSGSQGLRSFAATVRERRPGAPALLRLELREDLGRVQRRDFVRAPLMLPVRFRVVHDGEKSSFRTATTHDVGGGGLMMLVEQACAPAAGETLELEITLPDAPAVAHVVVSRVEPSPDNPRVARVCAYFTEIREQEQDRIVGRILARQAELHRAGLL